MERKFANISQLFLHFASVEIVAVENGAYLIPAHSHGLSEHPPLRAFFQLSSDRSNSEGSNIRFQARFSAAAGAMHRHHYWSRKSHSATVRPSRIFQMTALTYRPRVVCYELNGASTDSGPFHARLKPTSANHRRRFATDWFGRFGAEPRLASLAVSIRIQQVACMRDNFVRHHYLILTQFLLLRRSINVI